MATSHARRPYQKPKIIQYGKKKSSTAYNPFFDDDDDDDEELAPRRPDNTKSFQANRALPSTKSEPLLPVVRPATPKKSSPEPVKKRPLESRDVYDFPLSDDEETPKAKRRSPPKLTAKRVLLDDTTASHSRLAPWERAKEVAQTSPPARKESTTPVKSPARTGQTSGSPLRADTASPQSGAPVYTSAAARLAAKRKAVAQSASQSSDEAKASTSGPPTTRVAVDAPRKRAKRQDATDAAGDVIMKDTVSLGNSEAADISDFPESDKDSVSAPYRSPKRAMVNPKRTKAATTSRRGIQIGSSAPARLSEMITQESDTTEASASPRTTPSQPSTPPRATTPARAPATPSTKTSSPRPVSMTPKQNELWDRLLGEQKSAQSPGNLAIKDLSIAEGRRSKPSHAPPKLTVSKSDVGRVRRVDLLKAESRATQTTDDESSEDDGSSDEEMPDQSQKSARSSFQRMDSFSQQAQSQLSNDAPKITYSAVRSYLPEDSLEDGLLLGFSNSNPSQARSQLASQRSEFDLEDSDEDQAPARLKSVHELRAAGRSISFMQETESLLEEIANHALHARSRRRSALIELATKLADKAFVDLFIRQGFEEHLVNEYDAYQDDVADFILAAAMTYILLGDLPHHSLMTLYNGGLLAWLARLLHVDVSIAKLAKERKNNMSPAAQATLVKEFVPSISSSETLWEHVKPDELTPKIMAMRTLDLLIGKLRRAGDRSDLLDRSHLTLLAGKDVPDATDVTRISLAIPVLEALSTSSSMNTWPQEVVRRVAVLLPGLTAENGVAQHSIFLALRLALNLTNDNSKNCKAFGGSNVIQYLLNSIKTGFEYLDANGRSEENAIVYDLLVLGLGIMINLAERDDSARGNAMQEEAKTTFSTLLDIFQRGQTQAEEAESFEGASTNVAFGYLSIVLANMCQSAATRHFIASKLPGKKLDFLVSAVEEFVTYNQKADSMGFVDEEGRESWRAFTEKLQAILVRLQSVQGE